MTDLPLLTPAFASEWSDINILDINNKGQIVGYDDTFNQSARVFAVVYARYRISASTNIYTAANPRTRNLWNAASGLRFSGLHGATQKDSCRVTHCGSHKKIPEVRNQ